MKRVRVVVCALAAAFTATATPAWAENVVRWATPELPRTWDPHGTDLLYNLIGHRQVYEALTRLSSDLRLEPALAASWRLVDPRTWRFELRRGVRFHDGSPLTAGDVAFSLGRAGGEGSMVRNWAGSLEGAAAVDPSTVEIRTKYPDLLLPMRLRGLPVLPRAWAEAHGVAAATPQSKDQGTYARDHAMGTGPFRVAEGAPDGRVVLERNPDWWDAGEHPPAVDRIVWTAIPDDRERAAALLRGEVDFVQAVPADVAERVRATPGLKVEGAPGLRVFWLALNRGQDELPGSDVRGRNPFRDRLVREAVSRALDVDGLVRDALGGSAVPAGMMIAPGVNGWSEELDRRPPPDPDGARRVLAEAGYPDGFALRLSCESTQQAVCRNLADQLGRVGLRVEVDLRPSAAYAALLDAYAAGFYLENYQPSVTFDAAEVFRFLSDAPGGPIAGLGPRLEAIEGELSSPIRDALIEGAWREVLPDVVAVPLYRPLVIWAMRDWLEVPVNMINTPWFWHARVTSPAGR